MQRDDAALLRSPGAAGEVVRDLVAGAVAAGSTRACVEVLSRRCMSGRCWLAGRLDGVSPCCPDQGLFSLYAYVSAGRPASLPPRSRAPSLALWDLLLFEAWRRPPAFPTGECGRGFQLTRARVLKHGGHGLREGFRSLPLCLQEIHARAAWPGVRAGRSGSPGEFVR